MPSNYTPDGINEEPLSFVVSFQDATFIIWHYIRGKYFGKRIQLSTGSILFFKGHILHSGDEYANGNNLRLHGYIDTQNVVHTSGAVEVDSTAKHDETSVDYDSEGKLAIY